VRRRDFTAGLLLAGAVGTARAQQPAKQHRIALVIPAGSVASINDTLPRFYQAIFGELRRLGEIEGQNLTVERYSGEGRPEGFADLARAVVARNPDVIVAITTPIAQSVLAATRTIPIVWIGVEPILSGLAVSLARPGGNLTGVAAYGRETWGKRLQILKDAVPSASRVAFLAMRTEWEGEIAQLRDAGGQLQISIKGMPLEESTSFAYRRVFAEIAQDRPDAVIVGARGELFPFRQLIVELVEKNGLPAIYPFREYVELGGLMAYEGDLGELGRRIADDVHEILNGAKTGDIPIYQPTRFALIINLKAAKALDLAIPPTLLGVADEVIE
jgi:putative tryptophan/tyrosine transport system substrate-binding protein